MPVSSPVARPILNLGNPVDWDNPINVGLQAWYRVVPAFAGGTTWRDLARAYDGTLTMALPPTTTSGWNVPTRGGSGGEMRFNGSTSLVSLPANLFGILAPTMQFTWAFWLKPAVFTQWHSVLGVLEAPASNPNYLVYAHTTPNVSWGPVTNGLAAGWTGTAGEEVANSIDNALVVNTWAHVVLTWDGSLTAGSRNVIYVNAVNVTGGSPSTSGSLSTITTSEAWLGKDGWGDPQLSGSLDDVRYSTVAFTPQMVLRLYQESLLGYPTGLTSTPRLRAPSVPVSTARLVTATETLSLTETVLSTGTAFSTASDALGVAETVLRTLVSFVALTDTLTLAETTQETRISFVTSSDTVLLSETQTSTGNSFLVTTDTVTLPEVLAQSLSTAATTADTVVLSDSTQPRLLAFPVGSDTASFSENIAVMALLLPVASDVASFAESLATSIAMRALASDALALLESLGVGIGAGLVLVNLADSLALADAVQAQFVLKSLGSDTLSLSDTQALNALLFPLSTDTVLVSDTRAVMAFLRPLVSEALSLSETILTAESMRVVSSDTLLLVELLSIGIGTGLVLINLAESLGLADTAQAQFLLRSVTSDAVSLSDTLATMLVVFATAQDMAFLGESTVSTLTTQILTSETLSLTESLQTMLLLFPAGSDTASVSDTTAVSVLLFPLGEDTVTLEETPDATLTTTIMVAEAVELTDAGAVMFQGGDYLVLSTTQAVTLGEDVRVRVVADHTIHFVMDRLRAGRASADRLQQGRASADRLRQGRSEDDTLR